MRRSLYFVVIAWCVSCGCADYWRYSPVVCDSYDNVWQDCCQVMEIHGYTAAHADRDSGCWQADWQYTLYPLRAGGQRRQAYWQIVRKPEATSAEIQTPRCGPGAGLYQVRLRVVREVNAAVHDFMSERHAVWLGDGCDAAVETRLLEDLMARWALAK